MFSYAPYDTQMNWSVIKNNSHKNQKKKTGNLLSVLKIGMEDQLNSNSFLEWSVFMTKHVHADQLTVSVQAVAHRKIVATRALRRLPHLEGCWGSIRL